MTYFDPEFKPSLFIPGPVDVAPEVWEAMAQPMIGHRAPEFSDLYRDITQGIADLMQTEHHVYLSTSSATGLWEAAVRNIAPKRALCCINGAFSERWYKTVVANGFSADTLEVEWGKAIRPEMVRQALASNHYDMVTVVHNETSTGVTSPLGEIAEVMRDYPDVFFAVDAVSSMLGMPIDIDNWGVDILLASVQKAWALPPGFSICLVSDRVLDHSREVKHKGYYFDFVAWEKKAAKGQTIVTPSIMHMYGLQKQIDRIRDEGLDQRYARYHHLAKLTRTWAHSRGLSMFSEEDFHSDTVSCINNSGGWDLEKLTGELLDREYRFSRGYGKLKDDTFRIPHMGEITEDSLRKYLTTIEECV